MSCQIVLPPETAFAELHLSGDSIEIAEGSTVRARIKTTTTEEEGQFLTV